MPLAADGNGEALVGPLGYILLSVVRLPARPTWAGLALTRVVGRAVTATHKMMNLLIQNWSVAQPQLVAERLAQPRLLFWMSRQLEELESARVCRPRNRSAAG